jgi:predicted MFS family arabinose efflux permease
MGQDTRQLPRLGYATLLICGATFFSYLDRAGISILVEPIKADLGLSDAQIGVLTGFAFSLTYALFGVPLARITDTGNRVRLLAVCMAVWSMATAFAGLVTNFVQMVLTRIVVGIGEAGGFPASNSLIGDLYSPETRTRGMSWMQMSIAAGSWLGLIAVGYVAQEHGWRAAFFAMGAPGLVVAALIWFSMPEPQRGRFTNRASAPAAPSNWLMAIRAVLARRTIRHLLIGFAIVSFCGSGANAWLGAFFMRSHELTVAGVGTLLGTVGGVAALAGAGLGVLAGPKLVGRDRRWEIWCPTFAFGVLVPIYLCMFLVSDLVVASITLGLAILLFNLTSGFVLSSLQSVLPADIRGMGVAMLMLAVNLIGGGTGPLLVGMLSDYWAPSLGNESLRYAMVAGISVMGWGVIHFWIASRHYVDELVT